MKGYKPFSQSLRNTKILYKNCKLVHVSHKIVIDHTKKMKQKWATSSHQTKKNHNEKQQHSSGIAVDDWGNRAHGLLQARSCQQSEFDVSSHHHHSNRYIIIFSVMAKVKLVSTSSKRGNMLKIQSTRNRIFFVQFYFVYLCPVRKPYIFCTSNRVYFTQLPRAKWKLN